jgi:excisionase family DNA binding protein
MPYSVKEFAKILGFDEETITLWCRLGKLKAKKFGNRWRIYTDPTKP